MNFGNYAGIVANTTSIVTISCTSGTTYNVGLNAGTATGATVTTRKMTGPSSATLNYSLYSNSGLTINWGNTVGINTVAGTGTGHAQSLTVYGRIAAGQYLKPGSYSDTITATITY
jgi:spore coat protein U-like protein